MRDAPLISVAAHGSLALLQPELQPFSPRLTLKIVNPENKRGKRLTANS
jgi:hypothetical protein